MYSSGAIWCDILAGLRWFLRLAPPCVLPLCIDRAWPVLFPEIELPTRWKFELLCALLKPLFFVPDGCPPCSLPGGGKPLNCLWADVELSYFFSMVEIFPLSFCLLVGEANLLIS